MRTMLTLSGALLFVACSSEPINQDKEGVVKAEPTNILHITRGGIALADAGEDKRHWSEFTINLVDGSQNYGWTSEKDVTFPHTLNFELAGSGRISGIALDSTFAPVVREDGSASSKADGSAVRKFSILGSTKSPGGPYFKIFDGEAGKNQKTIFSLKSPVSARWIKLVINDNWNGGGQTRLSELELYGELDARGAGSSGDVSGLYSHEYGPIALKQDGSHVHGCYNDGDGEMEGVILGRTMRLGWYMAGEKSIGAATLVAANNQLYGFWYRDGDRMGSPWNATRVSGLDKADLGGCKKMVDSQ